MSRTKPQFFEALAQMKRTDSNLITDIDDIIRNIYAHRDDPEVVSNQLLLLAIKASGLGTWLIEAADEARQLESQYKYYVEKTKLELVGVGRSATVAESDAKVSGKSKLDKYHAAEQRVMAIKIKREDADRVMDAARSRLATIRRDIANG